jgi:hypothetical protein
MSSSSVEAVRILAGGGDVPGASPEAFRFAPISLASERTGHPSCRLNVSARTEQRGGEGRARDRKLREGGKFQGREGARVEEDETIWTLG